MGLIGEEKNEIKKIFRVNEYIELRLEGTRTVIYVAGERFIHCHKLVGNLPASRIENYESIDEIIEDLKNSTNTNKHNNIEPEAEFWGHCSSLHAFVESGYDTRILDMRLAFPLLKRLTEAGDKVAEIRWKEEICNRFETKSLSVCRYLINQGYLELLSDEEFEMLMDNMVFDDDNECDLAIRTAMLLQREEFEEAINYIIKSLRINPNNEVTWLDFAKYYFRGNCIEGVKICLENAVRINNNCYSAWRSLGDIYLEENRLEKAERAYIKCNEIDDEFIDGYRGLAHVNFKRGKFEMCIIYFNLFNFENLAEYSDWMTRGFAYSELARMNMDKVFFKRAIDSFLSALEKKSENEFVMAQIALNYAGLGYYERAIEIYKKIYEKNRDLKFFDKLFPKFMEPSLIDGGIAVFQYLAERYADVNDFQDMLHMLMMFSIQSKSEDLLFSDLIDTLESADGPELVNDFDFEFDDDFNIDDNDETKEKK